MKNSLNLSMTVLILLVLGCSCPQKLGEILKRGDSSSNSVPATREPASTPSSKTVTKKGEYDLSMAKYDQLTIGLDRSRVEEILGGTGTEVSSSKGGNSRFSVNKWQGDDFKVIILSFKNDKIMTKSQVGLDK